MRESQDRRQAWVPLYASADLRSMTREASCGHRTEIARSPFDRLGFLPLHFLRWPTDRRSGIGRCPTGRRQMRKSGEASCGHRANFSCELNLPGHRRMSAGWVLYRRITAGFLQDSSHGSPCADPAIDLALL